MKVLLVVPVSSYPDNHPAFLSNADFPVGIAYIAAALKQAGHSVAGLNIHNDCQCNSARELLEFRLIEMLIKFNPHMIGLGGLSTDIRFIADATKIIRSFRPHILIVLGGGIVTNDQEYIFELLKPDFCIAGDADESIVQLANTLETGLGKLDEIPGLGYWHGSTMLFNRHGNTVANVDSYPFPDYQPFGIEQMLYNHALVARYQYRYTRPRPVLMTLVAARGCPFSCTFCVHNDGRHYRPRSISNIMEEIQSLHECYHFNVLIILDELFAVDKKRLVEFSEAVLKGRADLGWDFDWCFQTHASAKLDKETLGLAKKAGCFFFSYGIESASTTVLQSMNKRTRPEQIKEAIQLAEEVSVGFGGNFIFGDPAETIETARESLAFYMAHCSEMHVNTGIVQPYPGSKIFQYCLDKGIISDKLAYYGTTDRYVYNMMDYSSQEAELLLTSIMAIVNNTPRRYAETSVVEFDIEAEAKEISNNGGRIPYNIKYICPYCAGEIRARELLDRNSLRSNAVSIVSGCSICHRRVPVKLILK